MKRNVRASFLFGLMLSVAAASLRAQGAADPAPTYGVDQETIYTASIWGAQTRISGTQWAVGLGARRYQTNAGFFVAPVNLPDGATIASFELDGCDESNQGNISGSLQAIGAGLIDLASVVTDDAATPGCGRYPGPALPHTVDNTANQYLVTFQNTTFDGTTSLAAARIGYRLQVSPAPPVPTFNDVPLSDPAYQFIEAFVRSGITVGCGGGNYCPDAPLTRRQMAVFFAKALGLQWPVP